jgi:hypothetical protein
MYMSLEKKFDASSSANTSYNFHVPENKVPRVKRERNGKVLVVKNQSCTEDKVAIALRHSVSVNYDNDINHLVISDGKHVISLITKLTYISDE